MSTPLEDYKQLISEIAKLPPCVKARWVREKTDWPKLPENRPINEFLSTLSKEQREVLAGLLDAAYDAGIHRLLVYLNDEIALAGLGITRNGRELPAQPFGSELYYDWVCHKAGDEWPDPVDEEMT